MKAEHQDLVPRASCFDSEEHAYDWFARVLASSGNGEIGVPFNKARQLASSQKAFQSIVKGGHLAIAHATDLSDHLTHPQPVILLEACRLLIWAQAQIPEVDKAMVYRDAICSALMSFGQKGARAEAYELALACAAYNTGNITSLSRTVL